MKLPTRFLLLLVPLLVFRITAIVGIIDYQQISGDITAFYQIYGYQANASLITNNGQMIFIASGVWVDVFTIDWATDTSSYYNSYYGYNGLVNFNRLFIFNQYLIPYSKDKLQIDVFGLNDFIFYQDFTINEYVDQFYHVSTKSIILYLTVNGKLGYIPDSSFIVSSSTFLIDQNCLGSLFTTFSVSDDQNYVALAGDINSSLSSIFIYNLANYALICQYNLTISGIGDLDWMPDNKTLLIASSKNGFIVKLDITICSGSQYTVIAAQTYQVFKMVYYDLTNEVIFTGLQIFSPLNYSIYSFSLTTNTLTFLKKYSVNTPILSNYFDAGNNAFFSVVTLQSVEFRQMRAFCSNNTIYDISTYSCIQQNLSISSNYTNITYLNTSSLTNNSNSNVTNNSIINRPFLQYPTKISNFQRFIEITLNNKIIRTANQVPGSRKFLQSILIFFINIDDLWLYNYHEREYDFPTSLVFNAVQQLQNQKWTLLQLKKLWSIIGLNSHSLIQQFSSKRNYSSWKFIQVQQNSNGFILNTLNFFCSNVLLMFIMFIFFRILFFLLFNYRISIFFRRYSFWLYFIMIILQGNVQYLTYLFSFQMKNFFSINFFNKIGLSISVLLYWIIFISAVAALPFIKLQYGRFISYFTQNLKVCITSFGYMVFQTGYRNILLGFLHIMFDSNYDIKVGALITTEIVFLLFTIALITKKSIFINYLKVWLDIIGTLLRILIVFTFFFDKNTIETEIQQVHMIIFYIYFSQMYLAIGIQIIKILFQAIIFLKSGSRIQQLLIIDNKNYQNKSFIKNKKLKQVLINQNFIQIKESKIKQSPQKNNLKLILEEKNTHSIKRSSILLNHLAKDTEQTHQKKLKIKIKLNVKKYRKHMIVRQSTLDENKILNVNIFERKG